MGRRIFRRAISVKPASTNIDSTPTLLINEGGNRSAWVSFTLRGVESNRDAVGARITVETGERTQVKEVNPFGSYLSRGGSAAHFGLGQADTVDRVVVRWPSGKSEELLDLPARMFHVITEGAGVTSSTPVGEPDP